MVNFNLNSAVPQYTRAPYLLSVPSLDKSWDIFVNGSSSGKEKPKENQNVYQRDLDWFVNGSLGAKEEPKENQNMDQRDLDWFVNGSSSGKEEREEKQNVEQQDLDWFMDLPVPYFPEIDPSIHHG